jgi:hypothetical protein
VSSEKNEDGIGSFSVQASLEAMDDILLRIQNRTTLISTALPVEEAELILDVQTAMQMAAAIREAMSARAARAGIDPISWTSRDQLISEADRIEAALAQLSVPSHDADRLRSFSDGLRSGVVVHRSETMKVAILQIWDQACQELLDRTGHRPTPVLPGPVAFEEWLRWAESGVEDVEAAGFTSLAEFIRAALPDSFLSASPLPDPGDSQREDGAGPAVPNVKAADDSPGGQAADELAAAPASLEAVVVPASVDSPDTAPAPPSVPRMLTAVVTDLPPELQDFESFERTFWINPIGVCDRAPWSAPDFPRRLSDAFVQVLSAQPPRFHEALVLALAAAEDRSLDLLTPAEVSLVWRLWADPKSGLAGLQQRPPLDLDALIRGEIRESLAWRIRIVMEAVAPREGALIPGATIELLLDAAFPVDGMIRQALLEILNIGAAGFDPVPLVRGELAGRPDGAEGVRHLEAELVTARRELQEFKKKYWNACGGKVLRNHCKDAWTRFMEKADTGLYKLYPEGNGGSTSWNVSTAASFIEGLPALHREIADAANAGMRDRKVMDRTAERLRDLAHKANDIKRRLLSAGIGGTAGQYRTWPMEGIQRLLAAEMPADEDGFLHGLLRRVFDGNPEPATWPGPDILFDLHDLAAHPDLLRAFRPSQDGDDAPATELTVRDLEAPKVAAAVIMLPAQATDGVSPRPLLRESLEKPHRMFLRDRVPSLTAEAETKRILGEELDRASSALSRIESQWTALAGAGALIKDQVRRAVDDGFNRTVGSGTRPLDLHLFAAWLERLAEAVSLALRETERAIESEANTRDEPTLLSVSHALTDGRLGDAVRLLSMSTPGPIEAAPVRETLWRTEALLRFPDPSRELREAKWQTPAIKSFISRWVAGLHPRPDINKRLREEFTAGILDAIGIETVSRIECCRISTKHLREWLARNQLNPSCIPQLARYGEILIATPKIRSEDQLFVQDTANLASHLCQNNKNLPIFLVPRLGPDKRQHLLNEWARRKLVAALIDDVDLCRLLRPGGVAPNPLLALMEIVLEQQQLTTINPFSLTEGQNVQMEMYFGRRIEARELAETARYSRLFSGRKLGKSALLKFVAANYDGKTLPSGKVLRVVYVSAVGVDSEAGLVQRILESFRTVLSWRDVPTAGAAVDEPGDRLRILLETYLARQPKDSLLIFMDEADVFIEHQVAAYHQVREKSLTFRMRSQMEAQSDDHGLPRVRFVFAGYRVANTVDGAWANWGEVLRLAPLAADDAAELISRPLARLGVVCTRQAPAIAHRCGYQPAVLLRFGERLLKRLEDRSPSSARTRRSLEVTEDDVVLTFEDASLQDEIRTVVRNNFQGNRIGGVVFGCILQEFLQYTPGHAIDNAEEVVIGRLRTFSPDDLTWFVGDVVGASGEVSSLLKDLVERQILVEKRDRSSRKSSYLLRFPHHLPVLGPMAEDDRIQGEIRSLQATGPFRTASTDVSGLLSPRQMQLLAFAGEDMPDLGILPVAVVGGHWPEALEDPVLGLPDRLGFDPGLVLRAGTEGVLRRLGAVTRRAFVASATPEHVREMTPRTPAGVPFPIYSGGIDLLRWAIEHENTEIASRDGVQALVDAPIGTGRIGLRLLSWWFERIRGLNFPTPAAIGTLHERTSGIPVLVRELDRILVPPTAEDWGLDLTLQDLERALSRFDASLPTISERLRSGAPSERLTDRELEILRMVVVVRAYGDADNLLQCLQEEYWEELYREACPAQPLGPRDRTSLVVLQRAGLLPVAGDETDDPFRRLIQLAPRDALIHLIK